MTYAAASSDVLSEAAGRRAGATGADSISYETYTAMAWDMWMWSEGHRRAGGELGSGSPAREPNVLGRAKRKDPIHANLRISKMFDHHPARRPARFANATPGLQTHRPARRHCIPIATPAPTPAEQVARIGAARLPPAASAKEGGGKGRCLCRCPNEQLTGPAGRVTVLLLR